MGNRYLTELDTEIKLEDLWLEDGLKAEIADFIEEQKMEKELLNAGLKPRNKLLLAGPPGNGKTSVAQAIAIELDTNLLLVKQGEVNGMYVGDAARGIESIFDYVYEEECVVLFDEFETLAMDRNLGHPTRATEAVNALLQAMDRMHHKTIFIGCTNHVSKIDKALFRRIQLSFDMKKPNRKKVLTFLDHHVKTHGIPICENGWEHIKGHIGSVSYAEATKLIENIRRNLVLKKKKMNPLETIFYTMGIWKERLRDTCDAPAR